MRINTSKVCLVKSSFGGLQNRVYCAIFNFFFSFFKGDDFSRKSLSKYLMDTIDFNKHDIDIFINLAKIVREQKLRRIVQWMMITINYIFWQQLYQCELAPIWRLQKYIHFNTYCGILSKCYNYKNIIIVDWILCPGEIKDYAIKTKIL